MKPIKFKESNVTYAENQPEYTPLPTLKINSNQGEVISCWKMSFKERITVLLTGKVWLSLMSFNKPLTPSFLSVRQSDIFTVPNQKTWYQKIILKLSDKNDPVKYCSVFKELGCAHVDGPLCDFPSCEMYLKHISDKQQA